MKIDVIFVNDGSLVWKVIHRHSGRSPNGSIRFYWGDRWLGEASTNHLSVVNARATITSAFRVSIVTRTHTCRSTFQFKFIRVISIKDFLPRKFFLSHRMCEQFYRTIHTVTSVKQSSVRNQESRGCTVTFHYTATTFTALEERASRTSNTIRQYKLYQFNGISINYSTLQISFVTSPLVDRRTSVTKSFWRENDDSCVFCLFRRRCITSGCPAAVGR